MPRKKIVNPEKPVKPRPKSSDGVKRGPLSNTDKAFINANHKKMTGDTIASRLKRTPETIKSYLEETLSIKQDGGSPILRQLRESSDYAKWQQQFMTDEMKQFENRYVELMGQFQNDVKKTDEIHIFQLISNEIQLDRILIEQKETIESQRSVHQKINILCLKDDPDDRDLMMIDRYQVDFENAKANAKVLTDRQKIFQERMDKAMQALKSTRDQRMKNNENRDKDFPSMIRFLMEEEELMKAGEELSLMQIARDKEYRRLSKVHKYEDGTMNPIIMNADTISRIGKEDEDDEI